MNHPVLYARQCNQMGIEWQYLNGRAVKSECHGSLKRIKGEWRREKKADSKIQSI